MGSQMPLDKCRQYTRACCIPKIMEIRKNVRFPWQKGTHPHLTPNSRRAYNVLLFFLFFFFQINMSGRANFRTSTYGKEVNVAPLEPRINWDLCMCFRCSRKIEMRLGVRCEGEEKNGKWKGLLADRFCLKKFLQLKPRLYLIRCLDFPVILRLHMTGRRVTIKFKRSSLYLSMYVWLLIQNVPTQGFCLVVWPVNMNNKDFSCYHVAAQFP